MVPPDVWRIEPPAESMIAVALVFACTEAPAPIAILTSAAWNFAGCSEPVRSKTIPAGKTRDPISEDNSSAMLRRSLPKGADDARRMGEIELAGAGVVAVDAAISDQRFDVIEGLIHLEMESSTEITVGLLQLLGARLQLRDHHSPIAGAGADTDRVGLEQHRFMSEFREGPGGTQAGIAAADNDDIGGGGKRGGVRPGPLDAFVPQDAFGEAIGTKGNHRPSL
jgi:hypothetical protein